MRGLYQWLALSNHPTVLLLRRVHRGVLTFSLPVPAFLLRPFLAAFLALRELYYFLVRVFVCEPLFKAYCTKFGKGSRTGVYIHWVTGGGRLIIGDGVLVDGKCSFVFSVRYAENPTLSIGDHTVISHRCSLTIGRQITIGNHCLIASGVQIIDTSGHPTDPVLRKLGKPANAEDVLPVRIEDNVWIGRNSIILPGVTIGEGSVVSIGSLVASDVPPYTIVAGNPARAIASLSRGGISESSATQAVADPRPAKRTGTKEFEAILQAVTEIICGVLGIDELDPNQDFYDAGVTSIMMLPLLIELEARFHVIIPQNQFRNAHTPIALSSEIAALTGEQNP